MKSLYPPPLKTRRNPFLPVLLIIVAVIAAALWFLSSQAREVPLTTIETDVTANAATR